MPFVRRGSRQLREDEDVSATQAADDAPLLIKLFPVPLKRCVPTGGSFKQIRTCSVRKRMAFTRLMWMFLFVVLYTRLIFRTKPDEDVMSAVHGEAVDEFFPDGGKASERLKESEVTAGLKEQLHADDVAQNLGWFTTFCREKAAADDHVRDKWGCRMVQTKIGPAQPPRWDLTENRGLIDDQVEDRHVREKLPFMQRRELTQEEKMEVETKEAQLKKVCSVTFLRRYVAIGNDPVGLVSPLHADYGDMDQFAENVLKKAGIDPISEDFDEYTVLDHNTMFEDQAKMVDSELDLTARLDRIDALLSGGGKGRKRKKAANTAKNKDNDEKVNAKKDGSKQRRPHSDFPGNKRQHQDLEQVGETKRKDERGTEDEDIQHTKKKRDVALSAFLHLDDKTVVGVDSGANAADISESNASEASLSRTVAGRSDDVHISRRKQRAARRVRQAARLRQNMHNGGEGLQGAPSFLQTSEHVAQDSRSHGDGEEDEENPYEAYPTGCFSRHEVMGQLRDVYFQADTDLNGKLDPAEFEIALKALFRDLSDEERHAIQKSLGKTSSSSFTIEDILSLVKTPKDLERMTLNPHGYLMDECRNHHWGLISLCTPRWVEVKFLVEQMERAKASEPTSTQYMGIKIRFDALGHDKQSGWYQARFSMQAGRVLKDTTILDFITLIGWAILVVLLFLVEGLPTFMKLPRKIIGLCNARTHCGDDPVKLVSEFKQIIRHLWDGRHVRHHFMSTFAISLEDWVAVLIPYAIFKCLYHAGKPCILPGQVDSDSQACMEAFLNAERRWTIKYFKDEWAPRGISDLENDWYCTSGGTFSTLVKVLFQAFHEGGHKQHIVALGMVMLRCLGLLNLWAPLNWIADTAFLAQRKLVYFMFVFLACVVAFAVAMRVMFGAEYMQFKTVGHSIMSLLLYTFGDAGRAQYAVYPFIENSGTELMFHLLIFNILIITIGLSFFTTVILDAYSHAQDPDECRRQEEANEHEFDKAILWWYYGPAHGFLPKKEEEDAIEPVGEEGEDH